MTTITVTEEDVRLGMRSSCDNCPIAKAAIRIWGQATVIPIKLYIPGASACLPPKAVEFILAFDTRKQLPPLPFSFEVDL